MYGRQLRKSILLQKQRLKSFNTKNQSQADGNGQQNHKIIMKIFTQELKKLLGTLIELSFMEKENLVLESQQIKKKILILQKNKYSKNLKLNNDESDYKFLKILHLNIWRSLAPFKEELFFTLKKIDQVYSNQMIQKIYSVKQFFQKVSKILKQKIDQTKNKILSNFKRNLKKIQNQKQKQKYRKNNNIIKLKDIEKDLKHTIYGQIQLDKIQAIIYFIEGLQVKDNVNNIFDRQWQRNKKAYNQIQEYAKKYRNKQFRIRTRSNLDRNRQDYIQKKENSSIYSQKQRTKEKQGQKQSTFKKKRIILKPINNKNQNKLVIKKP